jgi:hypothetical protein
LVLTDFAFACTCFSDDTVDKRFAAYGAVLIARFDQIAEDENIKGPLNKVPTFIISKVYKGSFKTGTRIGLTPTYNSCSMTFLKEEIGRDFLLFLSKNPQDGKWETIICSKSGTLEKKNADLLYLNKIDKVRGKTRLSGSIWIPVTNNGRINKVRRSVHLSGNGRESEIPLDENGIFEIYDLPPGKYRISAEKIKGYSLGLNKDRDWVEVAIKPKGHTEVNLNYSIENEISGNLFDPNGRPLEEVCLNLKNVKAEPPDVVSVELLHRTCTREKGYFKFESIAGGTYLIVVNHDGNVTPQEPFPTFYYPGVKKPEEAGQITVAPGVFRQNLIIKTPEMAQTVTFSGTLSYKDGQPAGNQEVSFILDSAGEDYIPDSSQDDSYNSKHLSSLTDENGRFSLRAIKGQKGKLFAEIYISGKYKNCPGIERLLRDVPKGSGKDVKTKEISIAGSEDVSGLKLEFPIPGCEEVKDR